MRGDEENRRLWGQRLVEGDARECEHKGGGSAVACFDCFDSVQCLAKELFDEGLALREALQVYMDARLDPFRLADAHAKARATLKSLARDAQ